MNSSRFSKLPADFTPSTDFLLFLTIFVFKSTDCHIIIIQRVPGVDDKISCADVIRGTRKQSFLKKFRFRIDFFEKVATN